MSASSIENESAEAKRHARRGRGVSRPLAVSAASAWGVFSSSRSCLSPLASASSSPAAMGPVATLSMRTAAASGATTAVATTATVNYFYPPSALAPAGRAFVSANNSPFARPGPGRRELVADFADRDLKKFVLTNGMATRIGNRERQRKPCWWRRHVLRRWPRPTILSSARACLLTGMRLTRKCARSRPGAHSQLPLHLGLRKPSGASQISTLNAAP